MRKILPDVPWPEKGDRLFVTCEDRENDALINRVERTVDLYAMAYKHAADALVEQVLQTGFAHDVLVLPIGFLYRQYLELSLKGIIEDIYYWEPAGFQPLTNERFWAEWKIRVAARLVKDGVPYPVDPSGHDLRKLWDDEVRLLIEAAFSTISKDDLDTVENCLHEFQDKDPKSDGFRYPATKKGRKTLEALSRVNLRNLKEVVRRVGALLEVASGGSSLEQEDELDSF